MDERGSLSEATRPATPPAGERRVALVIGNGAYAKAALSNPRNDAEALGRKLQELHPAFEVTLALDAGRDEMEDALEAFEARLGDCDSALFFFAGHGMQVKGMNYLLPVDADIRQEIHLRRRAFSLNEVLEIMSRRVRRSSIVLLDACRDNPFGRSLVAALADDERARFQVRTGLAEVRAATGTFIAFATAPDNVALDGVAGGNSPFTAALLEHVLEPHVSVHDLMIKVRRDVLQATNGRQEPWDQSSLRDRFCFHEPPTVGQDAPPPPPVQGGHFGDSALFERTAIVHWEAAKATGDPKRVRTFIAEYGRSRMGPLAEEELERLAAEAWRRTAGSSRAAVERFIEEFPESRLVAEASSRLAALRQAPPAAASISLDGDPPPVRRPPRTATLVSRGARLFVGTVFLLAGAAMLVPTGSLALERGASDWLAVASLKPTLFVFLPIFGPLILFAFYHPAALLVDLYWRLVHMGRMRLIVGTAVIVAGSILVGQSTGGGPGLWRLNDAAFISDTADHGGRARVLDAAQNLRSEARKRVGLSSFALPCVHDPLLPVPPSHREVRYCFASASMQSGEACCSSQAAMRRFVSGAAGQPQLSSRTAVVSTYVLPIIVFAMTAIIVIGVLLMVWRLALQKHYAPELSQMETAILVGSIPMLLWPLFDIAESFSEYVLFGNFETAWWSLRLSYLVVPWFLMLLAYFSSRSGSEVARIAQLGGALGSALAFGQKSVIADVANKLFGAGMEYYHLLVFVISALLLASLIVQRWAIARRQRALSDLDDV